MLDPLVSTGFSSELVLRNKIKLSISRQYLNYEIGILLVAVTPFDGKQA